MKESAEYEKAQELVVKFYKAFGTRPLARFWKDTAYSKRAAVIAIDEMINALKDAGIVAGNQLDFYEAVKKEISLVGI